MTKRELERAKRWLPKPRPLMRRLPKHLRANKKALRELRLIAKSDAARYGLPVYLVGSALHDYNVHPRDWDLRIEMPDAMFERMFGGSVREWQEQGCGTKPWGIVRERWARECVKQTEWAWGRSSLNVDFQIYPMTHARRAYSNRPRLRLA